MKTHLRRIRTSPKKMQVAVSLVKGKNAIEALSMLSLLPQHTAFFLAKAIKSALANAENVDKVDTQNLVIKKIDIQDGPRMKRHKAGSRGSAMRIVRRTIHLSVYLSNK